MDKSVLALTNGLSPGLGFAIMVGLGVFLLALSFAIKTTLVRNTHDFIIADRKVGFGFGVGSVIAVWTWAMAVMMSSAMTYQWGLSGLFWFVVPNGFAVIAMIPFARILRRNMPQGYTISEFVKYRFAHSKVASSIVTLTMIFGILLEILINLKGTSVVISTVFSVDWKVAAIVGIVCVLTYSYFGGLWTSVMTGTLNTLMVTVPAAIVVAAVYEHVQGGAPAFSTPLRRRTRAIFRCCVRTRLRVSASRSLSASWPRPSRIKPSGKRSGRSAGRKLRAPSSGPARCSIRSRSASACLGWSALPLG
jgi:Na+/proline symporter